VILARSQGSEGDPGGGYKQAQCSGDGRLVDPLVNARLTDMGQDIAARELHTPEALRAFLAAEIEKWSPIIKAAGIRAL
jgi:hypothetical protein